MFIFFLPLTFLTENENETNLGNQWKQKKKSFGEEMETNIGSPLSFISLNKH